MSSRSGTSALGSTWLLASSRRPRTYKLYAGTSPDAFNFIYPLLWSARLPRGNGVQSRQDARLPRRTQRWTQVTALLSSADEVAHGTAMAIYSVASSPETPFGDS